MTSPLMFIINYSRANTSITVTLKRATPVLAFGGALGSIWGSVAGYIASKTTTNDQNVLSNAKKLGLVAGTASNFARRDVLWRGLASYKNIPVK